MKKTTLFLALITALFSKAQSGLEAVIVEKYYSTNSADSANAATNVSSTVLHPGSVTYRVFLDMAPGYEFVQMFANQDALGNVIHPLIIKTTTDFYNDPNNGQVFPQVNTLTNHRKNTTMIDSWLSVGGVCAGKMGVLKTEDTDGSVGCSTSGVLMNNPGGVFGAPINSVVSTSALDGVMTGTPITPNALGLGSAADVFDQTVGNTFSITNAAIAALGGAMGVTASNMILIGQFTTNGILTFSINVQLNNTTTSVSSIYVPNNPQTGEVVFPTLAYTSATPGSTLGIEDRGKDNALPKVSVYPNPSKGIFIINASNVKENSANSYSLYDLTGRLVLTKNIGKGSSNLSETVDISGLNSGLYILNVTIDGIDSTKRIIKE